MELEFHSTEFRVFCNPKKKKKNQYHADLIQDSVIKGEKQEHWVVAFSEESSILQVQSGTLGGFRDKILCTEAGG